GLQNLRSDMRTGARLVTGNVLTDLFEDRAQKRGGSGIKHERSPAENLTLGNRFASRSRALTVDKILGILVPPSAPCNGRRTWVSRRLDQGRVERSRSEEHTSELQSPCNLVCRLLLEKKKNTSTQSTSQ